MPQNLKHAKHDMDIKRYIPIILIMAVRMRSVSTPPPELALVSFEYNVLPSEPKKDSIATKKTITPKPPIQCERQRQNIKLSGKSAKLPNTDAPVVVNPLVDSKKATENGTSRIII